MTAKQIQDILESPYNRIVWKDFLQTHFTNNKLYGEAYSLQLQNNAISKECFTLGNYEVDEYTKIGIFEVQLNNKVNITRNRVALRNLIKEITKQVAGAMVVFVQGDKWRFSYISKRKIKNAESNTIEDKETAPKRYTYLFGKNEKALTASIRFDKLIQKQKENIFQFLTLNDFEDAFSVEKLSKEFFKQYKDTYEDFVEYLTGKRYSKKGNKYEEQIIKEPNFQLKTLFNNDEKQARDFCKRMMGRIVFLYFIQKKGWLAVEQNKKWGEGNPDYLFNLFVKSKNQDNFYTQELVPLFFKTLNNADSENPNNKLRFPYLNGGLFDDSQDKKYNKLQLPQDIFNTLFQTFNNFNFTVYEDAPDEHTVAVDPEMLGHIFENLLEDNKDKGAFYTPKEIVHYMCKESLKEYLLANEELKINSEKTGVDTIEKIIQQVELNEAEKHFAEKNAFKIIDALERVKICDPAIGSGAFPMGLLQEIFNTQIYLQELKGFARKQSEAQIKKHIIEESIYGVDIDAGAVDIARLRFWLSLVVDEEVPQPLPNLDFKIVCANTLIPLGEIKNLDFGGTNEIVNELEKVRHSYFSASMEEKVKLEKDFTILQDKLLLTAKDWVTKEDASVYQKLLEFKPFETISCSWFDSFWMFGLQKEKGRLNSTTAGYFDIVIGNPPYAGLRTSLIAKEFVEFAKKNFKLAVGQFDYFTLFIEVSYRIANSNGIAAFIVPKALVSNQNFEAARKFLMNELGLITYVDTQMPFESASVESNIIICRKKQTANTVNNLIFSNSEFINKGLFDIKVSQKLPFNIFPLLLTENEYLLIDKVNLIANTDLGNITNIIRGFEFGFNHKSISKNITSYKVIKGENINRYNTVFSGSYVDADFNDVKTFKKKDYFTNTPKLLTRFVSNELIFSYDEVGYCNTNVVYNIHVTKKEYDIKYLLGVLNSNLLNFWFFKVYMNDDKLFPHIQKNQLESIPLIETTQQSQLPIITIVDKILNSKKDNSNTDTSHWEKEIDIRVYHLYHLSFDEAKLIDESLAEIEFAKYANNFLV